MHRGKAIADSAAKALQDEGILEHFIFSSLPNVKGRVGGNYEYVFHFDGKAAIAKYIEESLPFLHSKTSILYMAFYINNIVKYSGKSIGMQRLEDGSYLLPIPMSAQTPHPYVDPNDAGVFVDLLLKETPGKVLLGVGEYVSWDEFTRLWTEIVGRVARCKEMGVEEWDREIPGGFGREYAESTAFSEEFGWGAGDKGKMLMPKDVSYNSLSPSLIITFLWSLFCMRNLLLATVLTSI